MVNQQRSHQKGPAP
jgi:hypothetical protein